MSPEATPPASRSAPARRAPWTTAGKKKGRPPAYDWIGPADFSIQAAHTGDLYLWHEHPAIEPWDVALEVSYSDIANGVSVPVAALQCYVVRTADLFDLAYAMDNVTGDRGRIGWAVQAAFDDTLRHASIGPGMNSSFLAAIATAVDPFWQGGQLGPALVWWTALTLNTDAIFLQPHAGRAEVGQHGAIYLAMDGRWTKAGQRKVAGSCRRAGFRALRDGVWWGQTDNPDDPSARRLDVESAVRRAAQVANTPECRRWFRSRARAIERERQKLE